MRLLKVLVAIIVTLVFVTQCASFGWIGGVA